MKSERELQSAPALPSIGSVTVSSASNGGSAAQDGTSEVGVARAGVFGVSGANWEEGGVRGVEILGIAHDSAAETAGLHVGEVITDVDGRHVRSTQDLAAILAQNGPGTRISVGRLVKTGLGWMPTEAIVILSK